LYDLQKQTTFYLSDGYVYLHLAFKQHVDVN
jgi:hypothetical protein